MDEAVSAAFYLHGEAYSRLCLLRGYACSYKLFSSSQNSALTKLDLDRFVGGSEITADFRAPNCRFFFIFWDTFSHDGYAPHAVLHFPQSAFREEFASCHFHRPTRVLRKCASCANDTRRLQLIKKLKTYRLTQTHIYALVRVITTKLAVIIHRTFAFIK